VGIKGKPIERGKIFGSQLSDKGLIFAMCKELLQLNNNNNRNPNFKMGKVD
jgi:hypothetical protein